MKGRNKGMVFERELCREFSLWWTGGKRNDVFWRSAGSGGMATNRARRGQSAAGMHGDIQAVDPIGAPLTKLLTIEAKRGHATANLGDLLDKVRTKKDKKRRSLLLDFLRQAERECSESGAFAWLLVVRRDKRLPLVYLPWRLYVALREEDIGFMVPWCRFSLKEFTHGSVFVTSLEDFFTYVEPKTIVELVKEKM